MIRLSNTLSKELEEFTPLHPKQVSMYHCGPTVYDYAHIGNLRAYVFADTLRRVMEFAGFSVTQVINITDIGHLVSDNDDGEDKMTKALKREGKPLTLSAMREIANFYFETFKKDLEALNIKTPHHFPFASDHIKEDITLIETLISKGFAYSISDGIYFDTTKDTHYGKLGGITEDAEHSRISTNSEKKNFRDFALWKFNEELGFEAPFGKGFPGWHIECSAMSMKYLGETFDIHTGGIDHIPVHHNNEIAQSESATGKPFAQYWLHNAFVTMESFKEKNILPIAYRYWLLQARYSTPIHFSWNALESAQNAYIKVMKVYKTLPDGGEVDEKYIARLKEYVEDDLDTPKSLALLWELLKDINISHQNKKATMIVFDSVLGLNIKHLSSITTFTEQKIENLPQNIQDLIAKREEARTNKDFKASDEIREQLSDLGYNVEDSEHGPKISSK
jgi:cysteinyl-tRNA synthetase